MKYVYLDTASLTPIDKRVQREMAKVSGADIGNPSSIHRAGVAAKKILDISRAKVAKAFHAHADEIIFTGSGTEANNLAILGTVEAFLENNPAKKYADIHVVISAIEHASVLEPARILQKKGVHVDFIPVTKDGIIDLVIFKKMLRPETCLVSVMTANNEIGTIQPIEDIVKIVRDFRKLTSTETGVLIHTDASQAVLYTDINLEKLGVDMLTVDSHKVYGPRGLGMLFVRRSVLLENKITPILYGGGQENDMRPGTENIPAIAGFARAIEIAVSDRVKETKRLAILRDYFIDRLKKKNPTIEIQGTYKKGDTTIRLANNINVSFPDMDHEFFLLELDARGIACSTKSSCLRDEDESYVLRAMGKTGKKAQSLRFTLGRGTTKADIDYTLKNIDELVGS
jgi:cysteine desulfurase